MAGKINHKFVSGKPAAADPTDIDGPDWDNSLAVSEGSNDDLMKRDTGATDGWSLTSWLTYIAAKLFLGAAGAVGAPAHSFNGDPDTGMYNSGANALDFATGGVKALGIDSTQFIDSPTQPRCRVYHNATQSINNASSTPLNFNSEDYDVGGMHDTATNNERVTIPTGGNGLYLILGAAQFAANATGNRQLQLLKNGATPIGLDILTSVAAVTASLQVCAVVNLVATDYVQLNAYQNSGGALNAGTGANDYHWLSVVKLW